MTVTITKLTQLTATAVEIEWTTDEADPVNGWAVVRDVATAPNLPGPVGIFVGGAIRAVIDQYPAATPPAVGDVSEYIVQHGDSNNPSPAVAITFIDVAPPNWTTIDDVRTMLGAAEAGYTDEQITAAITTASLRLESVFCKDVTVDATTGLPTDVNVQTATTVMAARILVTPATGVPPVQGGQITSERMGSYSYSIRPGTAPSSSGPQTIDGYLKELVGGYLCPGYAGIPIQTDIWPYDDAEVLEAAAGVTTYP